MVSRERILESKTVIPFFGVSKQYANLRDELLTASDQVYSSGQVLDGKNTTLFEQEIARRCDRQYAVAVNSCTQGLIFAQQALFVKATKILIPTLSFVATINSVLLNGNEPVYCDTDHNGLIDLCSMSGTLDSLGIEGIMYPNLFGHTVDWDKFKLQTSFFNNDVLIVEDAAQSFGASYKGIPSGKLGDISVLSFDPTKNLNNYGSGGMLLTDDPDVYQYFLDLRDNGKRGSHHNAGTNSKMSESDCAQMLVKLKYFDQWQQRRNSIADYFTKELSAFVDIVLPGKDVVSAWSKFVMRLTERHALKSHLSNNGIESKMHYDKPLYDLPVGYNFIDYDQDLFIESASFSRECLSLPIYPELTDGEVEHIVTTVKQFYK